MAAPKVRLDSRGLSEVLRSRKMAAAVEQAGRAIAEQVDAQGLRAESGSTESGPEIVAEVEMSTTDRAHASVVIRHPAAAAMQARHGVLTKAAAAAGFEVKS